MEQTLLQQGVQLMLFGMGTVFVFLVLLILCTSIMSRAVLRFAPEEPVLPTINSAPPLGRAAQNPDQTRLIAAISAAVHRHRARRRE